jgi:hypothetical protein
MGEGVGQLRIRSVQDLSRIPAAEIITLGHI